MYASSSLPPTSDPLKLFMEDIEKTQTLLGKYAKIQTYLVSLKDEMSKIKALDLPKSKQLLDHEQLKSGHIASRSRATRVSEYPNLNPTNTLQAPQISMQSQQGTLHHGVGQQGSLQTKMQHQRNQMLQLHLARQQQQQQGLLQPQVMKPSQLQQQQLMQAQRLQKGLLQQQIMKLNPKFNEPSQLQQHRELLQHLGQQVFGQQE
ncbi:unnamed protein product [Eruca vesicaria subsp. sativa]|uniref:Uncharacterized protein n=1 Tax=Eruca vesicaria subsp. sativa TaxID=29727 RepID=A0ABC8L3A0_ERUVS|nr:unnamed protein product [Eruca vesicaria subsp. sativa]